MIFMKINWKDFVLMYVIGFLMIFPAFIVTFFVEWFFFSVMQDYSSSLVGIIVPLIYLLATLLPASAFYILRNKDDRKTMATIVITFGISFWIVAYLLLFLIRGLYAPSDSGLLT